jgi:hypothetical protein
VRNAIVLGAGRSGTSLLAGLFHDNEYFAGDHLWPPTESNPLGYFEDEEINYINEDLLDKVAPWRPRGVVGAVWPVNRNRPRYTQRWLSTLPAGTTISSDSALDVRMARQASSRPYLFKDPRFCYTLSAWRPHLAADTVYLCVFREPQRTADSIMRIIRQERYLRDLSFSIERANRYWEAAYRNVLHQRATIGGEWLFMHYDEILAGCAVPILEERLDASVDRRMLRADLNRSAMVGDIALSTEQLYQELSELARSKYSSS